jgi:hypothetical protein
MRLLRDSRLTGGDDAFGDRDYSGGGYFGEAPYLVMQDTERGQLRDSLGETTGGSVLLDGRPYTRRRV